MHVSVSYIFQCHACVSVLHASLRWMCRVSYMRQCHACGGCHAEVCCHACVVPVSCMRWCLACVSVMCVCVSVIWVLVFVHVSMSWLCQWHACVSSHACAGVIHVSALIYSRCLGVIYMCRVSWMRGCHTCVGVIHVSFTFMYRCHACGEAMHACFDVGLPLECRSRRWASTQMKRKCTNTNSRGKSTSGSDIHVWSTTQLRDRF